VTNGSGDYYWAIGSHGGKWVLLGPYLRWDEANDRGLHSFEGPFKVFSSISRDRGRVTQAIKEKRLGEGANLSQALERIGHRL